MIRKLIARFEEAHPQYRVQHVTSPGPSYYNKRILDEAGIPYPDNIWDWDTVIDAAKKLATFDAQGRVTRYGLVPFDWQCYIWQSGGDLISPDYTKATMNTPEGRKGVQFWIDLYAKHHVSPIPSFVTQEDTGKFFKTGKASLYYCGRWYDTHLQAVDDVDWDMTVIPRGDERASLIIGLGWCVPRNATSPDAAWELLKFLSSSESLAELSKLGYFVPPRKSVAESDAFLVPDSPDNNRAFIDALVDARPLPRPRSTPAFRPSITTG